MDDKEKRTKYIKLSLTDDEYKHIKNNADNAEKSTAVYARNTLMGKRYKPKQKAPPLHRDLLFQLARIGNNINQIAKGINKQDDLEVRKGIYMLGEIVALLQEFETTYLEYKEQGDFYDS